MRFITAILAAAFLAGCATLSPAAVKHPHVKHETAKKQDRLPVAVAAPPVIAATPAPEPPKPLTFRERFRETFAKIRWLHER